MLLVSYWGGWSAFSSQYDQFKILFWLCNWGSTKNVWDAQYRLVSLNMPCLCSSMQQWQWWITNAGLRFLFLALSLCLFVLTVFICLWQAFCKLILTQTYVQWPACFTRSLLLQKSPRHSGLCYINVTFKLIYLTIESRHADVDNVINQHSVYLQ